MKKITSIIILLAVGVISCLAQIQLTPYVSSETGGVDYNNAGVISNRLRSLISQNGMESSDNSRFVLAVKVNLLDSYVAPGAPPMVGQTLQVTFAIGDSESRTCFGTCISEVKGKGQTDNAAILAAFKNIRATPRLKELIATSKTKIINYYDQNGPAIIQKAQSLVTKHDYEGAIAELAAIPRECSCYPQASAMMIKIYQSNINHDAAQLLSQARALWAADPNPGPTAEKALSILGQIDTDAACYQQAQTLMKQIETRAHQVTEREAAEDAKQAEHERDMDKRLVDAETALENARISACREIAVERAKSRPTVVYNFHSWGWW